MPLKKCFRRLKPGWKWSDRGFCFTGLNAKAKAMRQGMAIEAKKAEKEKK